MIFDFIYVVLYHEMIYGQLPKVSVVIPVHNREKTLSACLNSILVQSLRNLEIICVDDGSVDGSLKVIKRLAKNDVRVVVLSQNNCGVSCARNTGLAAATGEYVNFVDSDDWIEFDTYEVVYEKAKQFDVDIVLWGRIDFGKKYLGPAKEFILRGRNSTDYLIPGCKFNERNSVCTKLYKWSVLDNGVVFDVSIKFGEDALFNLDLIPFINGVYCINRSFYHYNPSLRHYGSEVSEVLIAYADGLICHMNRINEEYVVLNEQGLNEIKLFAKRLRGIAEQSRRSRQKKKERRLKKKIIRKIGKNRRKRNKK